MLTWLLAGLQVMQAAAKTIPINVGSIPLSFLPDKVAAEVGDVLEFRFYPKNHSVVQGDYHHPCAPLNQGGFFSGFVPVQSGTSDEVFKVTVEHTEPMFFYCGQGNHCATGMVGVVNPTVNQTLAAYALNAAGRTSFTPFPSEAFGGEFGKPSSDSDTTSDHAGDVAPSESSSSEGCGNEGNFASDVKSAVAGLMGSIGLAVVLAYL